MSISFKAVGRHVIQSSGEQNYLHITHPGPPTSSLLLTPEEPGPGSEHEHEGEYGSGQYEHNQQSYDDRALGVLAQEADGYRMIPTFRDIERIYHGVDLHMV